MAADDSQNTRRAGKAQPECLSAVELAARLDEEIHRAARHKTQLSCLLVSLEEVEDLSHTYGEELPAQALAYLGAALIRQLRRFDRVGQAAEGELVVVLPGADERRAEIVARRALGRLHSVKVELGGRREALRISIGIAAWREGLEAEHLLSQTRVAAQRSNPEDARPNEPLERAESDVAEMPTLRRS
jgi:diguanylate cyclase (GGDEF)-like protein